MPEHRTLVSADVHEPKHITNSTAADAGKVITPLSGGSSELRKLFSSELVDGSDLAKTSSIVNNDAINYQGWEMVEDGLITTPSISVDTSWTKITIDDESVSNNTNEDHLPLSIRGTSNLWDKTNGKITPIHSGDSYVVRVNVKIASVTGTPEVLTAAMDIGGLGTPGIVVSEDAHGINKTAPYSTIFNFPIFCLDTFLANGGQIFMKTKAGSVSVEDRSILIIRTSCGNN